MIISCDPRELDVLTDRERQVLDCIALAAMNDQEIGSCIGIAKDTARSHVGRILRKLAARNRLELAVRYWLVRTEGRSL
jgi:DNA-binding CsgD family transcriptional regulator